jgi:hypothetical protein
VEIGLMIFGPALVGMVCLGVGIALFANSKTPEGTTKIVHVVLAVIFLLAALGIGSCYGVVFYGGLGSLH